jgi:glycolate oxidase
MIIAAPRLPRPSEAALHRVRQTLAARIGPSRILDGDGVSAFGHDESEVAGVLPDFVVLAESEAHVAATLEIAQAEGVPVTPRAGGTGRTGGAIPVGGGVVVATAGLARIKEIDRANMVAVVEPGVVTRAFHDAVEAEGLFYPPDPNSLHNCMLGGNVANNAGGPRALKYGVTGDYVLGLRAVFMGGRTMFVGRRTPKGVTGYDLTSLLVGSEGTLGVLTELTLRLRPKPPVVRTLLGLFDSVHACGAAVTALFHAGHVPRALELMDEGSLEAVRNQGAAVDPRARALLLLELDGHERAVEEAVDHVGNLLHGAAGSLEVLAAQDASQRDRLWDARRALSPATKKLARFKLSEDVVVPRSRIADLLREVDAISEATGVRTLTYGHAGDGNLHVNFLWNDPSERERVDSAILALMRSTVSLGGTLSGEHGIGVTKAAYLPLEHTPELVALQEDLKRTFDPKGLLNPGKIFPSRGHGSC